VPTVDGRSDGKGGTNSRQGPSNDEGPWPYRSGAFIPVGGGRYWD
jgi:hypothetical protein